MPADDASLLDRWRDPAYTGANRCRPCTVVNLCIAVAISAAVALVAPLLALPVLALSLLVVYLRGYLVPGTPTLTARYLPEPVLRAFGKEPPGPSTTNEWETLQRLNSHREHAVDAEQFLVDSGIATGVAEPASTPAQGLTGLVDASSDATDATEAAEGTGSAAPATETARVTADFSAAVDDAIEALDDVRAPLAALLETGPDAITIDWTDAPEVTVDNRVREWPSEAALRLDAATHAALTDWTDRWPAVPLEQRLDILETLRTMRETCPACGGPVEAADAAVPSCCGLHQVVAVACRDCGARLAETAASSDASKLDL